MFKKEYQASFVDVHAVSTRMFCLVPVPCSTAQGGSHVEVFSAQGRDPVAQWKLSGPVKREYDRQVRGYVYVMEGGSSTTRMQLPKSEKAMRKLAVVFQIPLRR